MSTAAMKSLLTGSEILMPFLSEQGFVFSILDAGRSSGGDFAAGEFKRGNRRLEYHFRHNLGLVTYHLGDYSISHQDYMRSVLNKESASHYPGFSNEKRDSFRDLLLDLQQYGSDFIGGTYQQLQKHIDGARATPFSRGRLPL